MKRIICITVFVLLATMQLTALGVRAEEKTELRYRFVPGAVLEYRMTQTMESPTESYKVVFRHTIEVLNVNPDGSAGVRATIHPEYVKAGDHEISADSLPEDPDDEAEDILVLFRAIESQPVTMTVSSNGLCRDMAGTQDLLAAMRGAGIAGNIAAGSAAMAMTKAPATGTTTGFFPVEYPAGPVAAGDSWVSPINAAPNYYNPPICWRVMEAGIGVVNLTGEQVHETPITISSTRNIKGNPVVVTKVEMTGKARCQASIDSSTGWVLKYSFEMRFVGTKKTRTGDGPESVEPLSMCSVMEIEKLAEN